MMTGQQLKSLILALDISQSELSDYLGYSRHAVNKWISRNVAVPNDCMPAIYCFFKHKLKQRQEKHGLVLDILYFCQAVSH